MGQQGVRSKEQGVKEKERGARSEESGTNRLTLQGKEDPGG
jgi:hypothetical protein